MVTEGNLFQRTIESLRYADIKRHRPNGQTHYDLL